MAFVFPCLLLNYFGQGALVLGHAPDAIENPFYRLAPHWALLPLVILLPSHGEHHRFPGRDLRRVLDDASRR